jgi:hypothetical protein
MDWVMAIVMPLLFIIIVGVPISHILHRAQPVVDNSGICAAAKSDWLMDICVHPMAEPRQLANTVQRIRCHNPSAALPFERLI